MPHEHSYPWQVCVELVVYRPSRREDRLCKVSGSNLKGSVRRYTVEALEDHEEAAKDAFHSTVPIACLDDYDITYTRMEEYEIVEYHTYKVTRRVLGSSPVDALRSLHDGDYESEPTPPEYVELNDAAGVCTDDMEEELYDSFLAEGFIDVDHSLLTGVHSITQLTPEGPGLPNVIVS